MNTDTQISSGIEIFRRRVIIRLVFILVVGLLPGIVHHQFPDRFAVGYGEPPAQPEKQQVAVSEAPANPAVTKLQPDTPVVRSEQDVVAQNDYGNEEEFTFIAEAPGAGYSTADTSYSGSGSFSLFRPNASVNNGGSSSRHTRTGGAARASISHRSGANYTGSSTGFHPGGGSPGRRSPKPVTDKNNGTAPPASEPVAPEEATLVNNSSTLQGPSSSLGASILNSLQSAFDESFLQSLQEQQQNNSETQSAANESSQGTSSSLGTSILNSLQSAFDPAFLESLQHNSEPQSASTEPSQGTSNSLGASILNSLQSAFDPAFLESVRQNGDVLIQDNVLRGSGTVPGDIAINDTTVISPGHSPGKQIFTEDQVFDNLFIIEIAGTTPTTEYDQIVVEGNTTFQDGGDDDPFSSIFQIKLISSGTGPAYTPSLGDIFDIFLSKNLSGFDGLEFLFPTLDNGLFFTANLIDGDSTIRLAILADELSLSNLAARVPEPATWILMALGILLLAGVRRSRKI